MTELQSGVFPEASSEILHERCVSKVKMALDVLALKGIHVLVAAIDE